MNRLPVPLTRSLPVVVSALLHVLFLAGAALLVWRASVSDLPARTAVAVHFDDPAPAPPPNHDLSSTTAPSAPGRTNAPSLPPSLTPTALPEPAFLTGLATSPTMTRDTGPSYTARSLLESTPNGEAASSTPLSGAVTFAGLGSSSVRSVVYVVDASGPMVTSLPDVFHELEASVGRLTGSQKFGVVVFRDVSGQAGGQGGLQGVSESFMPILIRATPDAKQRLGLWLERIQPKGRSNPMDGLRAALSLRPDAIFLLSRSIERSEGGVWGLGKEQTLREIDLLNPIDAASGLRVTSIQTIQFLDPDPSGIMQEIGRVHAHPASTRGVDPTQTPGYRYIPRGTPLGGN